MEQHLTNRISSGLGNRNALFDDFVPLFGRSGLAFRPARRFSTHVGRLSGRSNLQENRPQALAHPLRGQAALRLLPGQGMVSDNRTRQKEHPMRQRDQPGPGIACLGGLEAGEGPAQGLFAEAQARFHRPAVDVSRPNGLSGDGDFGGRTHGRQPGEPDGFRRFVLFQMYLGADQVAGQTGSTLVP